MRAPRHLRVDDRDRPRASSEDTRWNSDPAFTIRDVAPDDAPPRQDEQPDLGASKQETPLLSLDETTELFRNKVDDARQDTEHALDSGEQVSAAVKPKLTLDLGHSNIARLPESVVDLIKAEVERLSLSHNQIWHIPLRFSECSHLRYLNIKSNVFREIPRGVYKLPLLEILDIGWNKVRRISKEIGQLTSLRVFSIVHNRVDDLPTELCEMNKLQIVKIAKNPLRFKLKKIVEAKEAEVSYSEMTDQERETAVTTEIKRYLRELHQTTTPMDVESGGEMSEGLLETPRPARRITNVRFPVVPRSGEGSVDLTTRSPNQVKPPPIPTRSHFRVASGQNAHVIRRPGLAPLTGNGNERNRSNSESVLQASAAARSKRMGMLRKERSDLGTVDEASKTNNRLSHYRGLSYGSVLRPKSGVPASPGGNNSSGPSSPRDSRKHRQGFVKRLSSLPEHKRENDWRNPVIEGAKGILYALYQIHPQISGLIAAIKSKDSKRSSLEFTFYNASTHVDRLNEALDRADAVDVEDEDAVENAEEIVQRDCAICVTAYTHVTAQLQDSVPRLVANTDSRYVRTLMLLLYGSMIEIKNAISNFGIDCEGDPARLSARMSTQTQIHTIPEEAAIPQQAIRSATPTRQEFIVNNKAGGRLRSDTTIHQPILEGQAAQQPKPAMSQSPLSGQLPTPIHLTESTLNGNTYNSYSTTSTFVNGNTLNSNASYANENTLTSSVSSATSTRSRSNSRNVGNYSSFDSSLSSSISSTPRSGDVFQLPQSSAFASNINPATGLTDTQEESWFERIFLALTKAYDAALTAVPLAKRQFVRCLEAADESRQAKEVRDLWMILIRRCNQCLDVSEALQMRLVNMRLKDPIVFTNGIGSGRNDPSFWQLCKTFLQSFVDLVTDMKEAKDLRLLAPEVVIVLRPVQRSSREAGRLIDTSPWRYLTEAGSNAVQPPMPYTLANGTYTNGTNGTNGHAYYSSSGQHQLHQSPFPPPVVPVPPVPGSAAGNAASPGSVPLPATPLSAALGPAAQATVPSTPASAYGDQFFAGNVFQRADSLLNMPQAGNMNFLHRR
jgi:Leucine-rich repeat (LRR) protein